MKIRGCIAGAVIAAALFTGCGSEWKATGTTSKAPEKAYTATFYDSLNGISVGYAGLVRYTADGGKTWNEGSNSSMCLFSCAMIDAKNCIASGNGSNVVVSSDAGKTWTHVTNLTSRGKSLSFIDPLNGWASTKTWVGKTSDGGKTWTPLSLPPDVKLVETLLVTKTDCGYVVSNTGALYATCDGGQSWTTLGTPFPAKGKDFAPKYGIDNQSIALYASATDMIAASVGTSGNTSELCISKSLDGGKTWSKAEKHILPKPVLTVTAGPKGILTVFGIDTIATRFER